jgi:HJR/Mrr/RecB family endonuclease
VGLDLVSIHTGNDLFLQTAADDYSRARKWMRNLGILIWVTAAIFGLLLFRIRFGILLWFPTLGIAALLHLGVIALLRAWFQRRYVNRSPGDQHTLPALAQKLDTLCDKIVIPFFNRNQCFEGTQVRVSPEETCLLGELLAREGFELHPDMSHAFLTACTLRRDFSLFSRRIEACESTSFPLYAAYANLIPDTRKDRHCMPFLQEILAGRGESADFESVDAAVQAARYELKMKGFALDLQQRRQGEAVNVSIEEIDSMDPYNFELLVGMIYQAQGYAVTETPKSGDQGADVFIEMAGERVVIQTKLYGPERTVGNDAVREVIAAKDFFRCQKAIVVTNRSFTRSAKELAQRTNVTLAERMELIAMLDKFNKSPKDYARLSTLLARRAIGPTSPRGITKSCG